LIDFRLIHKVAETPFSFSCLSVHPLVCIEHFGSHLTDFYQFYALDFY